MMYNAMVALLKTVDGVDDAGFPARVVISQREIYANERRVRTGEYYGSAAIGWDSQCSLGIRRVDYGDERVAIYNGRQYEVIRGDPDRDNPDMIELLLGIRQGGGQP